MSKSKKTVLIKREDLSDITSLNDALIMPHEESEPFINPIKISFDCEISKETMEWIKKQSEALEAKESALIGKYRQIAKRNAGYYLPILQKLASEESKEELIEEIIMTSLCRGWNDCFEVNVKHNI